MIKSQFFCLFVSYAILYSCVAHASESEQQVLWVDVRSWAENQFNSIEGDLHIPHQDIVEGIKQHIADKNTPIKLYCKSGVRAGKALQSLRADGYSSVENVGGITDVRRQRFSVD